ncbi:tRNA dihydrouridine synthase DusB [Aestuariivirga litoralis]|uniref:tRNA dihydrouridine synthase DusB n=1 Tax=Aestuariivirga litoralis TaxID=2650924 RepID=UPI0018C689DD|nr:tRNA dihydrouridine synthase DusB [Aestuariivirga litoralis]MBG1231569.1 tRNA dihydrouridine synthase DusB [Aestuariivirga litoralis]
MGIQIGKVTTRNNVFLAPMSGVTDEPFRKVAHDTGAGLVVSEMVASDALVQERRDMVRRARGAKQLQPFAMQLAGREAKWMSEGAKVAQDMGADIIDINMGCPARQVTGGLSGSALMRDLGHAVTLIEATVAAVKVPVTLKMRLGWDDGMRNAPELARYAEASGIAMVTVHGRTRCQFYKGKADWNAILAVRDAIKIPLVANGDCNTADDARAMLAASGADAVMVGRGAYGRPWLPGQIAEALERGTGGKPLGLSQELALLLRQQDETLALYGATLGNKIFRKHLSWTVTRLEERELISDEAAASHRTALLGETDNAAVTRLLRSIYSDFPQERLVA